MARWQFSGGALKFPITLPAGDYIYTGAEGEETVLSSAYEIVIDKISTS